MKITIIGTGYVGLVTGACFAQMGNSVICVDIDKKKIKELQKGIVSIYEPGLKEMVLENSKNDSLNFTTDIKYALKTSNICFIAVGTPMGKDGSADLDYILSAASSIGRYMDKHTYIIDKSTVPVGTADLVRRRVQKELDKRGVNITFDVASNPEFLKEGDAIGDFMKPDRVIIGSNSRETIEILRELYAPFSRNHDRFITMDIRSAEMAKYAANAMLATKISFINEIASICEEVGADVNLVRKGIGSDSRIGYSFIYPGCGYGGSCFPKDIRALIKTSVDFGYEPKLLKAVEKVNFAQKLILVQKIQNRFGENLSGLTFAVWGLSFKPETNDMREATSITVINELTSRGAKVKAYDPKAICEAKEFYFKDNFQVEYVNSKYDALNDSEAMILLTEWKEFRSPDFEEIAKRLKNQVIFDGRNQYDKKRIKEFGFEYYQIGVSEIL